MVDVASKLIHVDIFNPNAFYVELIFRPSVLDTISNWCLFDDNRKIIDFLHMDGTIKDSVINDFMHEQNLQYFSTKSKQRSFDELLKMVKPIPRSVVRLEHLYNLHDRFKNVNCNINSFVMSSELINLGTQEHPQCVNLEVNCSPKKGLILSVCSSNTRMYLLGSMTVLKLLTLILCSTLSL